jgi:hypothetical protein
LTVTVHGLVLGAPVPRTLGTADASGDEEDTMRGSGARRSTVGRNVVRLTLVTVFAVTGTTGSAAASPGGLPASGFSPVPCGGEVGTVLIAGHGSGLGFGEDGTLWRRQEGEMRGLEGGYECHGNPVVRIR